MIYLFDVIPPVAIYGKEVVIVDVGQIVGIVTPFSPQAYLIANLIKKKMPDTKKKGAAITIGTAHLLQGADRDRLPGLRRGSQAWHVLRQRRNMINVAVSRAKDSFLVFGNMSPFKPEKSGAPSGLLAKYLFESQENDLAGAAEIGQSAAFTFL